MEDEERAPLRAANLRTPGRCLVLTASSFGVSWTATVVFYAVVVFHLDVGMHQTLQRTIWTSGGVLLFCLAAAIWSGRSVWKHMAGKPGKVRRRVLQTMPGGPVCRRPWRSLRCVWRSASCRPSSRCG